MNLPANNINTTDKLKLVRIWLLVIVALIFAMVLVGGATRLTDSGLSITEWKPILGAIPPLSTQDWLDAFDKYKKIPEYKQVNTGMSLEEFKFIYWWEWAHRFLGRFIGLAFFIPMVAFWMAGVLNTQLKWRLVGLFILGGLQGALGWYMVASGLAGSDRVDVSQYRLAAHLGLAILILMATYWVYMGLRVNNSQKDQDINLSGLKLSATVLLVLIFLQILLGALVAGIHAGKYYNTWPLMGDRFIPDNLLDDTPWYLNFFENPATVQFDHRMLAYVIFVLAVVHIVRVIRRSGAGNGFGSAALMVLALTAQIILGIWTLLAAVPLSLGLIHQAGAIVLLLITLEHLHSLHRQAKADPIS